MSTMTLPATGALPPPHDVRYVSVFANLLPDEVIDARRGHKVRAFIALGLGVTVLIMLGCTVVARIATSSAHSDLDRAQAQTLSLQHEQSKFSTLMTAQGRSAAIEGQLKTLMSGDLQWAKLLSALRAAAPAGVNLAGAAGDVTAGPKAATTTGSPAGLGVLDATANSVGTMTITGTAPDKASIAAYLDALAKVPGIAVPYPASVTAQAGSLQFTANFLITSKALGGRYATTTTGSH